MIDDAASPATGALATQGRRFAGFILDVLLAIFTLAIGWLVWFLIIAGRGQTPAKQILRMRVVREDGQPASYGWMLLREIGVKIIAFAVLNFALVALIGGAGGWVYLAIFVACALWCVWDANRQCLWDKALRTLVVHDPEGVGAPVGGGTSVPVRTESSEAAENLRTLAEMRDRGLLTDAEYEERRQRELERL